LSLTINTAATEEPRSNEAYATVTKAARRSFAPFAANRRDRRIPNLRGGTSRKGCGALSPTASTELRVRNAPEPAIRFTTAE